MMLDKAVDNAEVRVQWTRPPRPPGARPEIHD